MRPKARSPKLLPLLDKEQLLGAERGLPRLQVDPHTSTHLITKPEHDHDENDVQFEPGISNQQGIAA